MNCSYTGDSMARWKKWVQLVLYLCAYWSVAMHSTVADSVATTATPDASNSATGHASPPPPALSNLTRLLHASQFPSDCSTRRFLLVDPSLFNVRMIPRSQQPGAKNVPKEDSLDLARLHLRLAGALAEAYHSKRTLVFTDSSRVIRSPKQKQKRRKKYDKKKKKKKNKKYRKGRRYRDSDEGRDFDEDDASSAGEEPNAAEQDIPPPVLTPQQIVKILMRKCSIFHYPTSKPFYAPDEPYVARLRYHHSCWFAPISSCDVDEDVHQEDWEALEDRPGQHDNRLKYSELNVANAAMWIPPQFVRDEDALSLEVEHIGAVERWSSALVNFVSRPVELLQSHLHNFKNRTINSVLHIDAKQNHPNLAGVYIRPPPLVLPTQQPLTQMTLWKFYMKILQQLVEKQQTIPVEDRFLSTRHLWISTWEEEQYQLIDRWHDQAKINHTTLGDIHFMLSQLRQHDGRHHVEEHAHIPGIDDAGPNGHPDNVGEGFESSYEMHDPRAVLDRLNLQALHVLEDGAVLGHSSFLVASAAHAHSVWLQCLRNSHDYSTPPIWTNAAQSSEGFFPALTGFEQDEGQVKAPSGKTLSNGERWARVAQVLADPLHPPKRPAKLSTENALPDIPYEVVDRLLPLWSSPITHYERPHRDEMELHDEL